MVPAPTRAQLQLLQSLFDVSGKREPDVILIVKDDGFTEAISLRENSDLSHCPIIDLTSHFSEIADGSLTGFDSKRLKDIANTSQYYPTVL